MKKSVLTTDVQLNSTQLSQYWSVFQHFGNYLIESTSRIYLLSVGCQSRFRVVRLLAGYPMRHIEAKLVDQTTAASPESYLTARS